ncbi:MAG: hypothetical protein ACOYNI_11740 [Acidimicrobiia bacterium]
MRIRLRFGFTIMVLTLALLSAAGCGDDRKTSPVFVDRVMVSADRRTLTITGGLPDPCTRIDRATAKTDPRSKNVVVTLAASRPTGGGCAAVITGFSRDIALTTPLATDTVIVNGTPFTVAR